MSAEVLTIILGGGRGSRLYPLTKFRSKPAVPIGGKYRLIDIPLSNCINSGFYRVYVLTQFMSASLNNHISSAYSFDQLRRGFVEVIAATQSDKEGDDWFQGTADAVRKSMIHFRRHSFEDYLILSGDHLYRMDYRTMLRAHRRNRAEVTVATIPVAVDNVSGFGILKVDDDYRITNFIEKPKSPTLVSDYTIESKSGRSSNQVCLASMGIYIFKRSTLNEMLRESDGHDFGYNLVPEAIRNRRAFAFRFNGYWEDIGQVGDFYRANLRMTDRKPDFSFYDPVHPIYTSPRHLPGSVFEKSEVSDAIVCDGCIISRSSVTKSIIGIRTIIAKGCTIRDSLIMGSDYYTGEGFYPELDRSGLPALGIGPNCEISGAIIDKNARIGAGVKILPKVGVNDYSGEGFEVRNGITVVEKNAVIPPGTKI